MRDEHPALALVARVERGEPVTVDDVDAILVKMTGPNRVPDLIDSLLDIRWRCQDHGSQP